MTSPEANAWPHPVRPRLDRTQEWLPKKHGQEDTCVADHAGDNDNRREHNKDYNELIRIGSERFEDRKQEEYREYDAGYESYQHEKNTGYLE